MEQLVKYVFRPLLLTTLAICLACFVAPEYTTFILNSNMKMVHMDGQSVLKLQEFACEQCESIKVNCIKQVNIQP